MKCMVNRVRALRRAFLFILIVFVMFCMFSSQEEVKGAHGDVYFGYKTVGGSSHLWAGGDDLVGCKFTCEVDATVGDINVYINGVSGNLGKCAIYYASNMSFYIETEELTLSSGAYWESFIFIDPPTVLNQTNYYLCFWTNTVGTHYTYYDSGSTNQTCRDVESYNGFPATLSKDGGWDQKMSIYANLDADYKYRFYGLYEEGSGVPDGTVSVTANYEGESPETFEVDGVYEFWVDTKPLYFVFDLVKDREYWLSGADGNEISIYIFNATTTTYTISFLDLTNRLTESSYISAKRQVNDTLYTIEKRRVSKNDKVVMNLQSYTYYNIYVGDGTSYQFGDIYFTTDTTVELTLTGIEFPKETLLTYKYIRIYGLRAFGTPDGNITITYEDTLNQTNSVEVYINYKNGTNAYNTTYYTETFQLVWTSAENDTDYAVVSNINHTRYGVYTWKQYFPRTFSEAPFGLDFLGALPFDTSIIIPAILIVFAGGCFSVINAEVGAFMATITAIILTYLGWIPINAGYLITAFTLCILMAIIYAKRRVQT